MKITLKRLTLGLASAGLLTIYGCGGGGGGTAATSTITTPTTLTGVAATGAAFTDAIVTVTDSKGIVVGTSAVIGADGTYSITLLPTAVAPLVLTASRTTADGAVESMVSIIPSSSTAAATINITPVTNLIASRLSSSGDPTKLASELAAGTSIVSAATVAAKVLEIQTILAPILTATGTTATDPLGGTFATNGTGYDRLLDSLKVTITPASATATNVEIGIKQQLAEGTAPTAIQFTNGAAQTSVASVPAIPTITALSLVPSGTSGLIAAHLAQLNTCFALPVASRVNSTLTGTSPNQKSVGTAVNVVAANCRNAFIGNDPANYKSNGKLVGRDANDNGAFAGLFKEGATGLIFSQGTYEFTRGNGDFVIGYKSKDTAGNETFDTFVVRADTDGKLKQIGNQYTYGGGVTAYHQLRDFVNQASSTYYSTGYNLNVPLIPGVAYVKVTTPKGSLVTLIPGSDGMVLPKLNTSRQPVTSSNTVATNISTMVPSGTTFIRVRSEYADTTSTATHPATRESGLFFSATDALDTEISTYANQSLWRFEYYDSSDALLATQNYKTRTRAMTLAELRTMKWANLAATTVTNLQSNFVPNSATPPVYYTQLSATANVAPTWEVTTGALPPTQIKLFGNTRKWASGAFVLSGSNVAPNYDKTSFNDGFSVGSATRTATIPCANGNGELHCQASPTLGYQPYASMTGLHLWSRDIAGSEFARFYATYNLP